VNVFLARLQAVRTNYNAQLSLFRYSKVVGFEKADDNLVETIAGERGRVGDLPALLRAPFAGVDIIKLRQAAVLNLFSDFSKKMENRLPTTISSFLGRIYSTEVSDGQTYYFGWRHEFEQAERESDPLDQAIKYSRVVDSIKKGTAASNWTDSLIQASFLRGMFDQLGAISDALPSFEYSSSEPLEDAEALASLALQAIGDVKLQMETFLVLSGMVSSYRGRSITWAMPEIVEAEHPFVEIENGMHPVLALNGAYSGKLPQPVSISLGLDGNLGAVITGPNAYGKTTSLKMIYLLSLLAQIGAPVPAARMRISPFNSMLFFSSEGNQSLARGLSGFTGEIDQFDREALGLIGSGKALFVGDEMFKTTDPLKARPLLLSVTENLLVKGRATFALATHFREGLEAFGAALPSVRLMQVGRGFNPNVPLTRGDNLDRSIDPGVFVDTYTEAVAARKLPPLVIAGMKKYE
jgi:hypothetical protein